MPEAELQIYVNGEFYPESQARISVLDHLVIWGDGVYDVCFAKNGKIFKLNKHIERLWDSAKAIRLDPPVSRKEAAEIFQEAVRINGLQDAYVKMIFTRGVGEHVMMDPQTCQSGIITFARPHIDIVPPGKGLKAKVSAIRRIPDQSLNSRVKSCNYLNHVLVTAEAKEAGYDTGIELRTDGYVSEGPGFNIFTVKDDRVFTPGVNILMGITRATIIELAEEEGIDVDDEALLATYDLYSADEVFFTSSAGGLFPVTEIDNMEIGDGQPGPITMRLRELYNELLVQDKHCTNVYK